MASKINTGLVTPPLTWNETTAPIAVGTRVDLDDGGTALFVQAASTVSQYAAVLVYGDNTVVPITTTNAAQGTATTTRVGFAQTSLASNNYGWVQLSGRPVVKLAQACADSVLLYTTGTAGVLDDATISGSCVVGIHSQTTTSTASAITCVCTECFIMPWANPA